MIVPITDVMARRISMVMVNLREIKKDQIDFIVIVDLFFKSNSFRYYEGYIPERSYPGYEMFPRL